MMITTPATDAPAPPSEGVLSPLELRRLRWRCRRGMLENDLILTRFLDARGSALTAVELAALDRLLDLPDGDLWQLLCGRVEPESNTLRPLVTALRAM